MSIPISFWGTPSISASLLEQLVEDHHFQVQYVVTQPDKPRSRRGQRVEPSAVKKAGRKHNIPIWQPENPSEPQFERSIQNIPVQFHVVLAYGHIIPKHIFKIPPQGAVNFHASLLPVLRGASPIEFSLWESHSKTGWSLQQITSRMDAGDIIEQIEINILWEDHQALLHEKMEKLLLSNANDMLKRFLKRDKTPLPQDELKATYCRKLVTEDGRIDWNQPGILIRNLARAMGNRPGVFSNHNSQKIKIFFDFSYTKKAIQKKISNYELSKASEKLTPGMLFLRKMNSQNGLWVVCGNQCALPVQAIQISGKSRIQANDFINSYFNSGSIKTLSS